MGGGASREAKRRAIVEPQDVETLPVPVKRGGEQLFYCLPQDEELIKVQGLCER